jgi:phospholipid transport system substrate-binding protein
MNTLLCRRRAVIAAAAGFFVAATPSAHSADSPSVIVPIQELVDGLLQVMKAGVATPFLQRYNMLAPVIDQTFDLTTILRESIGSPWATLPSDQQAQLTQAFRRYTVVTYINSFNQFEGQRFEVDPATRAVGTEQVVQTRIIPRSGDSHELDYVMREGTAGWRAVDVLADGSISRVAVQRSDFRRLLTRGGALALLDSLRSKSADLSDGQS